MNQNISLIKCSALGYIPDHQANTNNRHDCYYNIDNIFCSELCRNKVCGFVLSDATDHMPIFFLCDNSTNVVIHEDPTVKYKRKLDEDSLNRLGHDLNDINWEIVMNESNPNLAFSRFMQVLSK